MGIGIRVSRIKAEEVRKLLKLMGVLDEKFKVAKVNDKVIFPITRELKAEEVDEVLKIESNACIVGFEFEPKLRKPRSLIEALSGKLEPWMLAILPRSFSIVGDIAIIEIPDQLYSYRSIIGEGIMAVNSSVKAVYMKTGGTEGIYRIRPIEHIAGERRTETIHVEYGCRMKVDISKVYFNPSLSYEHVRVASKVVDGETVIDMFTGVGSFALHIALRTKARVYAIDINPEAIKYLNENLKLNKLKGEIIPIYGDAREIINSKLQNTANRIIMNLPHNAIEFIDVAIKALRDMKGIIHYYTYVASHEGITLERDKLLMELRRNDVEAEILEARRVLEVAPYELITVFDVKICRK
ncbi:MAG: class I SAM-dependent methyltransferase family protein [Candidatus Methanomethylicia archaeon]